MDNIIVHKEKSHRLLSTGEISKLLNQRKREIIQAAENKTIATIVKKWQEKKNDLKLSTTNAKSNQFQGKAC